MKKLLLTLPLLLAPACGAPGVLPMSAPVERSIERVVERHDSYVENDETLDEFGRESALSQSDSVRALMDMPPIDAGTMTAVLSPVMDRHDFYVMSDGDLDPLDASIFLGSTQRLRAVLSAASR